MKKSKASYPRAFISFDFDNNKSEKDLFVGQIKLSKSPFDVEDWSSKRSLPQHQWERLIKDKINKCNMLIALVGPKSYTATGVKKEIVFAKDQNVPVFGVYVGGADTRTKLPEILGRNRTIIWEWSKISAAINQVMKEGKNKSL